VADGEFGAGFPVIETEIPNYIKLHDAGRKTVHETKGVGRAGEKI
jgi:hypothetical protein